MLEINMFNICRKSKSCREYIISSSLTLKLYRQQILSELKNRLVLKLIFGEKFAESSNIQGLFESENYAISFSTSSIKIEREWFFDFTRDLIQFEKFLGTKIRDIRSMSVQFELFIPSELDIKPIFFQDRICNSFDKASLTLVYKDHTVLIADAKNNNQTGLYMEMSQEYEFNGEVDCNACQKKVLKTAGEFATKFGILT